jgi:flagellar basal-body rod protein FlgB
MQPVDLFRLAAQQANWLATRQSAVAGNIANANTPGYAAVDVVPFEQVLARRVMAMSATNERHVVPAASYQVADARHGEPNRPVMPSGNTVELESELMKSGEVRRSFELNTAIVGAFHRMILMTTRG